MIYYVETGRLGKAQISNSTGVRTLCVQSFRPRIFAKSLQRVKRSCMERERERERERKTEKER